MIKGVFVLISSILSAALYTLVITIFRDRVLEIIYDTLSVPASSPYSTANGYTDIITWCLYLIPIVMVLFGIVYFLMSGPRTESDSIPAYYGGVR
jgi:hypothetical protein